MTQARKSSRLLRLLGLGPEAKPTGDLFRDAASAVSRLRLAFVLILIPIWILVVLVVANWHNSGIGILFLFVGLLGPPLPVALVVRRLRGRELDRANQVLTWWAYRLYLDWEALDGGRPPDPGEDDLARIADRSDDLALRLRIGVLAGDHRYAEARSVLESWAPTDPIEVSNRERRLSGIAFDTDRSDDTSAAEAAIGAIPDEPERTEQRTLLAIERARRISVVGRDPLKALAQARELLDDESARLARTFFIDIRPKGESVIRPLVWAIFIIGLVVYFGAVLLGRR